MNQNATQRNLSDYAPGQRFGQIIAITLIVLILSLGGVSMLWQATAEQGLYVPVRALLLVTAVLMLLGAVAIVISLIKRKLSTGRFFLTRAEALAKQAEMRARMGAGKPFWPQARP